MIILKIFRYPLKGKMLLVIILACILLLAFGGYWLQRGTFTSGEVDNLDFLPPNLYGLFNFKDISFEGKIYYTLRSNPYGQRLNLYGRLTPEGIYRLENDPSSIGFERPKYQEYRIKANEFLYPNVDILPLNIIKIFQFYPDGKWSYRTLHNDELLYYLFQRNRTYITTAYIFRQSRLCIIFINNNLR